jgi:hemerythrin
MKNIIKKLENIFAAAAYAEAGEQETAKQIMEEVRTEKRVHLSRLERIMMAITFAEAGEHETAREIMREEKRTEKRDRVAPKPRKQLRA